MSKPKLLPCPKCQCPDVKYEDYEDWHFVMCKHCNTSSRGCISKLVAKGEWNNRDHWTKEIANG